MTAVSALLLSHNKPEYVLDAITSVIAQTFTDWELWIIENSTDDITRDVIKDSGVLEDTRVIYVELNLPSALRERVYVPAWLVNRFYPALSGDYLFYISDDDTIARECFAAGVGYLTEHLDRHAVYFTMAIVRVLASGEYLDGYVMADKVWKAGAEYSIDGGQVLHRSSCLKKLKLPFFPEGKETAFECDAAFVNRLGAFYDFYPIPAVLVHHRRTPKSLWRRVAADGSIICGEAE